MSRAFRRATVLAVATLTVLAAGTGIAGAHVSASSADASPGGYGKVTFRVPNESDTASTTGVRIQLPTDTPLTSVRAQPVAGWTVALIRTPLDPPVEADGEQITEAVTVVQYTSADGAGGIAPGQFGEFALSGGPFPNTDSVTFNVVQTYSDGSEAAWIEPTVSGQAEPEYPAPVLDLSGATGADHHGSTDAGVRTEAAAGSESDERAPGWPSSRWSSVDWARWPGWPGSGSG